MASIDDVKNPVPATNAPKGVVLCLRGTPEGCSCPKCVRNPEFCNEAAAFELAPQGQFRYLLRRHKELESKMNMALFASQIAKTERKEAPRATPVVSKNPSVG